MSRSSRLPRRRTPRRAWIFSVLQILAIILATVLGVYGAASVLQNVLIKRAMVGEAEYFWRRYENNGQALLPDTNNMVGFLRRSDQDDRQIPEPLRDVQPGYHRVPTSGDDTLVFVSDGSGGRLYLVFNQEQVARLSFLFGFIPLSMVLLIVYLTTWLTYRASRRAFSPVMVLARTVRAWDPKQPDLAALDPKNLPSDPDGDVATLARALHQFASRIEGLVERERNFTRDASHELRSPLTVVKVAADVLQEEPLSDFALRAVDRIRRSTREMEAMIETFLILAREADTGMSEEEFAVNESVREQIERARPLLERKPVVIELEERAHFALRAPPRVFAVLIANLIRNACLYTEAGRVHVIVGSGFVQVVDTGIGMSEDEVRHAFQPYFRGERSARGGYGVGLSLVRRLSDRFGWPVDIHSQVDVGTTATIKFPQFR